MGNTNPNTSTTASNNNISIGSAYSTLSNSIAIGSGSGSTYTIGSPGGQWVGADYTNEEDFTDICLNVNKLDSYEPSKREMLFQLFMKYIDSSLDYNRKPIVYNTLMAHNLLIDRKALERKNKIESVIGKDKSENKEADNE